MSRLTEDKARALLVSGHVRVRHVDDHSIAMDVSGYTGQYRVTWAIRRGWHCTCPERKGRCSHLLAARRITCATERATPPAGMTPARDTTAAST